MINKTLNYNKLAALLFATGMTGAAFASTTTVEVYNEGSPDTIYVYSCFDDGKCSLSARVKERSTVSFNIDYFGSLEKLKFAAGIAADKYIEATSLKSGQSNKVICYSNYTFPTVPLYCYVNDE